VTDPELVQQQGVGEPDALQRLWTPHRMAYIKGENKPELTVPETLELAEFTQRAMKVGRAVATPHGFNIGMNQGVIAGAGIAAHLHQHLVPRWGGDANFMPVIGHTKVLPQLLAETRQLLADAWKDF
jgi:ATP adenylyltransferase